MQHPLDMVDPRCRMWEGQVVTWSTTWFSPGTPVSSHTNDALAPPSDPTSEICISWNNLFLYRFILHVLI